MLDDEKKKKIREKLDKEVEKSSGLEELVVNFFSDNIIKPAFHMIFDFIIDKISLKSMIAVAGSFFKRKKKK
ncbi:MAG: hypothetical protein ACOCRK_05185 [bacterium]